MRTTHWEVSLVRYDGRTVETRTFYDLEKAKAFRDEHTYKEPSSDTGVTVRTKEENGMSGPQTSSWQENGLFP